MTGLWLLFTAIAIASLPVIPAWFWASRKSASCTLSGGIFLLCLTGGFLSVLAAALIQSLLPLPGQSSSGLPPLLFRAFLQISLIEELSRLVSLIPLLRFYRARHAPPNIPDEEDPSLGARIGLVSGLGFAIVESAFYSAAGPGTALLRAFTAAPLHGACGARLGSAAASLPRRTIRSLGLILSAVLLHGLYDFFILSPGIPSALSILIALSALGSTLVSLHGERGPRK
jgi:RsiW-degrading membrane proteinase PrsW (M82 family)